MKTLQRIHGVPFRKIVKRVQELYSVTETLSCGHTHIASGDPYYHASKRRCYSCKWAKRLAEQRLARGKYPYVRSTVQKFFCLELTDVQIKKYAGTHDVLKRDVADDICDTIDRDLLIDAIVVDVLGTEWHWPLNGDVPSYGKAFYPKFYAKAQAKGIKLTESAKVYL